MNKIGILYDSSCGFSKEKVEKDGNYFVPILIEIQGKEYSSGIDLDNKLLFEKFKEVKEPFKTSAVRIKDFEENLEKALQENEKVIVITISKHLSSTYQNLDHFVKSNDKYKDRVLVYESYFLTPWIQFFYEDLNEMIKYEKITIEMIYKMLDFYNSNQKGYISPENLERLRIGGRLSETQYKISKLLKIQPIIEVINGSLNDGRVFKVRKQDKAIEKIVTEVESDYKLIESKDPSAIIRILYLDHGNVEARTEMQRVAKERGVFITSETILAPEINAHVGERAFGMGVQEYRNWKKFIN